jgi:hypothetical protein
MFGSAPDLGGPDLADTDLADTVDRLRAAVDDLVAVEVHRESDEALRDAVRSLAEVKSRVAAAEARVTREFDLRAVWALDEAASAAAWIRVACRVPAGEASAQVALGRHLSRLPATAAALEKGEITAAHARRIGRCANRRTGPELARDEEMIVGWARELGYEEFHLRLIEWALVNDPDGPDPNRRGERYLNLAESFQGGYDVAGWLDAITGTAFSGALERREQLLFDQDWADARRLLGREPTADDLPRTSAQRRVDALYQLVCDAEAVPDGGRPPRILVSIVAGQPRFADLLRTHRGDPLASSDLAAHLDECVVEHMTIGDDQSPITRSRQRTFPDLLRRAIRIRDERCTHGFCDVPAHRCECDHIVEAHRGGPTSIENGRLRCGFHNRLRNTRNTCPPPPDDG